MYKITSRTLDGVSPQRGWKAREEAARARLNKPIGDELAANIRDAGERDQAERDAAAAAAIELERHRRETACPCPACDGGEKYLSVKEAAWIASALQYYRSHNFKIDDDALIAMDARAAAKIQAVTAPSVTASAVPLSMGEDLDSETADSDDAALAQLDAAPTRRRRR